MTTSSSTIDAQELESLLQTFISFQTIEGNLSEKQECLDWVQTAFLSDYNGSVQRGEHSKAPWLYVDQPDAKLLIFAHLDVVPASEEMFHLQIDGDNFVGRGVADMKGHILPFLVAFRDSIISGSTPPINILLTTDEETAGDTIPTLLDEGIVTAKAAFTPDCTDKGIVCKHKGAAWSKLTVHGKGGHGAYPWDTDNPYWKFSRALETISKNFPGGEEGDWQITVTPTALHADVAANQVPPQLVCTIDIRFPPEECEKAEQAVQKVQQVLPDGCSLELVQGVAPLLTDQNHPAIQSYKAVADSVLNRDIPFRREHGGTDARYFSERGIPAFLFGCNGGSIHAEGEWVSRQSLIDHYKIYSEWIAQLSDS